MLLNVKYIILNFCKTSQLVYMITVGFPVMVISSDLLIYQFYSWESPLSGTAASHFQSSELPVNHTVSCHMEDSSPCPSSLETNSFYHLLSSETLKALVVFLPEKQHPLLCLCCEAEPSFHPATFLARFPAWHRTVQSKGQWRLPDSSAMISFVCSGCSKK